MSIAAMSLVMEQGPDLNGSNRMVLLVLADHCNGETGRAWPTVGRIARRSGIKREETVREALRWLEAGGWIERRVEAFQGEEGQIPVGKRPNVYLLTFDRNGPTGNPVRRAAKPAKDPRNPGNGGSPDSGDGGSPDGGEQNRGSGPEPGTSPPTPPQAGGGQGPQLELIPGGGAVTVEERKAAADPSASMAAALFEEWKAGYPSGTQRGDAASGLRAWRKALKRGDTSQGLTAWRDNYAQARIDYAAAWAHAGYHAAPLMRMATFLNGKGILWAEPWSREDLAYWPPPKGWSWDDLPVTSHDGGDDCPPEVRAAGTMAMAEWYDQRNAGVAAGG